MRRHSAKTCRSFLAARVKQIKMQTQTQTMNCPTCLTENPKALTVSIQFEGEELHFCRCPYRLDTFKNNLQYYLDRLVGKKEFKGLFTDNETAYCH